MTILRDYRMQQCAEGVLVGLKRCTLDAASVEIAQASRRHHMDSRRVAHALVRLAQDVDPEADSNATAVARYEWGALLPRRGRPRSGAWLPGFARAIPRPHRHEATAIWSPCAHRAR